MSNIRTNLPVPTRPWEDAKVKFLAGLSPEDVARFIAATPENLFYDASTAQKKHAQQSRSWLMQERVSSLVDAINDYGKALDVYSNSYGLILCPIWGSLRIVLQIAGEAGKFQENLVEMLAQIGDVLPRFRIYQALFSDHERLLVALSNAFLDLLKFCTTTKDFFLKGKKSMIPLTIVLRGAWKPFRQGFENYMIQFRQHCKLVEKEANVAHMIESARIREVQRENRALQLRNGRLQKRHRILCAIPTVNYRSQQTNLSASRHPGTNKWIQDTEQYKNWISSPTSDWLCCYGIPGSGKSVLASSVVEDLFDSTVAPVQLVLYHYCDYAQHLSLSAVNILYSLIKQLLEHLPLDHFTDTFQCPFDGATTSPGFRESTTFLKSLMQPPRHCYIILDGLDQLSSRDQSTMVDFITIQLRQQNSIVKTLITSRLNECIIQKGLASYKTLTLSRGCTDDMRLFVQEQINLIVQTKSSPLEDRQLKEEVIKALLSGANGMFLWLKFQLFDIAHASTKQILRNTISNFPEDLNETYGRILVKVLQLSRNDDMRTVLVRVFRWILGARRPLTVTELEEAIGLDKNDQYLHFDRVASHSGEKLITNCGNLVILNENDSTVAFAHQTVQQYLHSMRSDHPLLTGDLLSSQHANQEIGEICLAYLSFSDFETQLIKVATNQVELEKAEQLVWSNVPLGKYIKGTLLGSWKPRRAAADPSLEYQIRFPLPNRSHPSDTLNRKYAMLDYVISSWIWHTAHLTTSSDLWVKFHDLVTRRNLVFNFRPWDDEEHQIKVRQVLSPEPAKWQIRDLMYRGTELLSGLVPKDLSIYCFMMRYGIRSLLPFVNKAPLLQYIKRYQPASKYDTSEQCIEAFFQALQEATLSQAQYVSFWSGHLIFHLTTNLDLVYQTNSLDYDIIKFAHVEHQTWAVPCGEVDTDKMFLGAILLALEAEKVYKYSRLMRYYVTTPTILVETLLSVIRKGHERTHVINTILHLPIDNKEPWSSELMWKYLFALDHCSPTILSIPYIDGEPINVTSHFISLALLALVLGRQKRPSIILRLLNKDIHTHNPFILETIDWRSQAYGTAELYDSLIPLVGSSIYDNAKLIHEIVGLFKEAECTDRHDRALNYAIHEAGTYFSIEAFEEDGIHCLLRAVRIQALNVVETLVPMYLGFLDDVNNRKVSLDIVIAIGKSDKDFSSVRDLFATVHWPGYVVQVVERDVEESIHWVKQPWILDMVLASSKLFKNVAEFY